MTQSKALIKKARPKRMEARPHLEGTAILLEIVIFEN
jgi:hypothetical protein